MSPTALEPQPDLGPLERAQRDRELMHQVQQRDETALGALHDRFAPTLNALALRILRDEADAEEVVQEALVHAWNRADSYDPGRSSVSTWLVLVTRSRAIDRLRSRRVVDRTHDQVRHEVVLHESPQGGRRVQDLERRQRVRAALRELPDEQRQVLDLAYYSGLTQSEIAQAAQIPLGTVKTRTLLAMRKLRSALRDELQELL